MKRPTSEVHRAVLLNSIHEAYMEVFPSASIESDLQVLGPNAYVAVTCSPSKGVDETIDMTERLVEKGYNVIPHVAARMVRDKQHLQNIIRRLKSLQVKSLFVPGGDALKAVGEFNSAFELLRAISDQDHQFVNIGVAAHPEGHPDVSDKVLFDELLKKQQYANYMVTQMCFDAKVFAHWLKSMRDRGISMPVWLGLPGVINRSSLFRTSIRIGVGESLRYLRKNARLTSQLMKSNNYIPDDLVLDLVRYQADPSYGIVGYHIFCFNQVERSETWRHEAIRSLT